MYFVLHQKGLLPHVDFLYRQLKPYLIHVLQIECRTIYNFRYGSCACINFLLILIVS